jgi:hypothetical protein
MGGKGKGSEWSKIIDRDAYNTTESHMHRTHKVIPERRRSIILIRLMDVNGNECVVHHGWGWAQAITIGGQITIAIRTQLNLAW